MKKKIIKFLIKLLDSDRVIYENIDDTAITEWLEIQTANRGFTDYIRKRDLQVLKSLGNLIDRDNYLILIGQRLELLRLLHQATEAYELTKDKKGRKKLKGLNKK